jgi:hypothetical protein
MEDGTRAMTFEYQPEIQAQLLTHGVRPLQGTRPALVFRFLGELYRYELRRLKAQRAARAFPPAEYGARVIELRRRYALVSVPVKYWTVPGTTPDPEDVPLC